MDVHYLASRRQLGEGRGCSGCARVRLQAREWRRVDGSYTLICGHLGTRSCGRWVVHCHSLFNHDDAFLLDRRGHRRSRRRQRKRAVRLYLGRCRSLRCMQDRNACSRSGLWLLSVRARVAWKQLRTASFPSFTPPCSSYQPGRVLCGFIGLQDW